jgi:hypothetical protein
MKSKNFTRVLFFFLILFTKSIFGQLNGAYTIGGTTPDYPTIQAAAAAVQTGGISGPVVFNIRPGTYAEKVDIGTVTGASAVNTITFKAENNDSTSVIITDNAGGGGANYTFHIFGTDYLIIRNVTIQRPGADVNSRVISIGSNPKYLQIRNCIIQADLTNTSDEASSLIHFPLGSLNDSGITISNNILIGDGYGLFFKGQSAASQIALLHITNNQFIDQGSRAMQLTNVNTVDISGNDITTHSTNTTYRAVFLTRGTGAFVITNNKIIGINSGGNPIHLDTCSGTAGNAGLVANNFIQTQGTGTVRGIYIQQGSNINIFYNTINITTIGNNAVAFYINNSGNTNLVVKNNIFVNTGGGITYRIPAGGLTGLISSDHNDLYVPVSSQYLALLDTNNISSLADWQIATNRDSNSVSGDPQFNSSIDLHSGSAVVNDLAVVVPGVVTDIDGQTRSNSTPDIGADEFTPLSDNIGMLNFISPVSGECGDSLTTFGVIIHNFGLDTQTGFPVHAEVTGDIAQSLSEVYSDSLVSNGEDTIYFSQTLNTYSGASVNVSAYVSLTPDQFRLNDTINASFTFLGHPNPPAVTSPQQQCDNNVQATATPDSGDVLFWYDQPAGGNLLYVGNPFHTQVTNDTTFYVESHSGSGSLGCLRITEIEPDDIPSDYFEIQNISGTTVDATGWKVYVNADNSDINNVNDTSWALGVFAPGEVQYRTDDGIDHYWGNNLLWTGGSGSWVLIIDDHGNIIDFVVWDWDSTTIQSMNITVNGFNISPGSAWSGDGYSSCVNPSNQRVGTDDHDNASDWTCQAQTMGTANANLASAFIHCGIGFCGSVRLPVEINLISGITPVFLGNDTSFSGPFSLTLDADTGYTTYLWSTGETTQTIQVSTFDTYWVTVTGGTNGCSYTDSITISSTVGIGKIISSDEFSFYPNPASDKLILHGHDNIFKDAIITITDLQGREAKGISKIKTSSGENLIDISSLSNGVYFLRVTSGQRMRVEKFFVLK